MLILESVAYHRNGVGGEPFHVVLFTDTDTGMVPATRRMVGIVFPSDKPRRRGDWVSPRVAVLDRDMTARGDVAFGRNSWRGDHYSDWLYAVTELSEAEYYTGLLARGAYGSPAESGKYARTLAHAGLVALSLGA